MRPYRVACVCVRHSFTSLKTRTFLIAWQIKLLEWKISRCVFFILSLALSFLHAILQMNALDLKSSSFFKQKLKTTEMNGGKTFEGNGTRCLFYFYFFSFVGFLFFLKTTEKQISYNQSRKSITLIEVDIHKFSLVSILIQSSLMMPRSRNEKKNDRIIETIQ